MHFTPRKPKLYAITTNFVCEYAYRIAAGHLNGENSFSSNSEVHSFLVHFTSHHAQTTLLLGYQKR